MRTENIREVALDEIVDLPVHPVAAIFPTLAENSTDRDSGKADKQTITLAELADSIIEHGLQEPIVLFDSENGKVLLDGRNRRLACIMGKVETVTVEDFIGSEEEAHEFIFTLNLDRRDMTPGQRAKAAAEYWDLVSPGQGARRDLQLQANLPEVPQGARQTRAILAQRFRAGQKYVDLIHKELEAIERERNKAEKHQAEADEHERLEKEAEAKIELAKAEGKSEVVKEAVKAKNEASVAKAESREEAAKSSEKALIRQRKVDRVQKGESVNSVYGAPSPGQNIEPEDPYARFRSQLNGSHNKWLEAADELLDSGRPEDRENVRVKTLEIIQHFGNISPVEGLVDADESRERFYAAEQVATAHGEKMADSPSIVVKTTKDCGCDFSGMETCDLCRK